MRLRHDPAAAAFVAACPLALQEKEALLQRGHWAALFGNDAPICLEIGMGRGRFLTTAAAANPAVNYLGLELRPEMVMQAALRLRTEMALQNLRFLQLDAALLPELFAPGELSQIYLHFPDPWPKARHAKRRLTTPQLLACYYHLLCSGGELYFKTDNPALFAWSLENFRASSFHLVAVCEDDPLQDGQIMTEYEARYRQQGIAIHSLRAVK